MEKIFIANRGEIALRIVRAARDLGISTVIGFSDADAGTLPMRLADEKIALEGNTAPETYLNIEKIISAARIAGADAIHPGYGFLAENSEFARRVIAEGMIFIGPSPESIKLMGDKSNARRQALMAGVPLLPGTEGGISVTEVEKFSEKYGFPLVLKAVAGGSGRGMRIVRSFKEICNAWEDASAEAERAFSNGSLFAERFLERPRHIEVQLIGDAAGDVHVLGERECSVQRRHQKLIEECPAPRLHPEVAKQLAQSAKKLAESVNYKNSGTVEFLVEGGEQRDSPHYFLEMNTRIQVEHPVTEEAFQFDLLQAQIRVARGEKLANVPSKPTRHSIEFRIYAEDPENEFRPNIGQVNYLSRLAGPGIREDGWAESGTRISPYYDSLLTKLICTGKDRAEAVKIAHRALEESIVDGVSSTLDFHRWIIRQKAFLSSEIDVYWISRNYRGETLRSRNVGPLKLPETQQGQSETQTKSKSKRKK